MASPAMLALVIIVITVLLPPLSSSDFLAPLLSPVIGDFCKQVGCGKGKCKMSENQDLEYECECDPGWKQTLSNNNTAFKFLPCVIPNCTLDQSCTEAAAPAPSQGPPPNASMFEPCYWANCGGGVCNKTSAFTYSCECRDGYYNLLNNTAFPCFKECSIGGDCSNLGIPTTNQSTTPAPNLSDTGTNQGSAHSIQAKFLHHIIMLVISIVSAL